MVKKKNSYKIPEYRKQNFFEKDERGRSIFFKVRLTPEEKELLEKKSKESKQTQSDYIRRKSLFFD